MPDKASLIENALLMPFSGSMDSFESGVFKDGALLAGSLLHRGRPAAPVDAEERLAGTCLFGGYLFGHFGHFLVESLARLHAIRRYAKEIPILFMSPNRQVFGFQQSFFKMLGVRNEIILVQRPVVVERLLFAQPGCGLSPLYITDEQMSALARHSIPPSPVMKKVWLSRSKLRRGFPANEPEIESALAAKGWEIVRLEELMPLEQVKAVNSADYVAGFDGSAFYLSLFSRRTKGKFFIFGRRDPIPEEISHFISRQGIPVEEYLFPLEYLGGEGVDVRLALKDPEKVLAVLEEKAL